MLEQGNQLELDKLNRDNEMETESCLLSIQITQGTTMHIKIAADQRNSGPNNWYISTLLIKNNEQYLASTAHNLSVDREWIASIRQMIQQLPIVVGNDNCNYQRLWPLQLPREPVMHLGKIHQFVENDSQVTKQLAECKHYKHWRHRTSNILQLYPEIITNTVLVEYKYIRELLCNALATITKLYYEHEHNWNNNMNTNSNSDIKSDSNSNANNDSNRDGNRDDSNDNVDDKNEAQEVDQDMETDEEQEEETEQEQEEEEEEEEQELEEEEEEEPEEDDDDDDSEIDDYDEDEEVDEVELYENWLSGYIDDDFYDASEQRPTNVQPNIAGRLLALRLNAMASTIDVVDNDERDLGSYGSIDDNDDLCSELSHISAGVDDWQHCEDRSFETGFSCPMRRLIGEIPALTAQEERMSFLVDDDSDETPSLADTESLYGLEQWQLQQESLSTGNINRSTSDVNANDSHASSSLLQNFSFRQNVDDMVHLRQNLHLIDTDQEQLNTELLESELDNPRNDGKRKFDHELQLEDSDTELKKDKERELPIVPLALYVQQTADLIAKLMETL